MKKFQKYYSISFLFFQTVLLILVSNTCLKAQDKNELKISFWNVENLFDLDNESISKLEIPTGNPLLITLDTVANETPAAWAISFIVAIFFQTSFYCVECRLT